MKFSLYAIYALAGVGADIEHFERPLPFEIAEGVSIEDVSALLQQDTFNAVRARMGTDALETLQHVRHALVHRYEPRPVVNQENQEIIGEELENQDSQQLVRYLTAWLRIIRPMRQSAQLMHGNITQNGRFDVVGFDHPVNLMEVPENQKLFSLRSEDADELHATASEFLRAMRGDFWKFRMAMQFHDLGHYQQYDAKARYLLWASAIEAIYTSHDREHKGSLVAKERIKWFLGENTSIYPGGELSDLLDDPHITTGDIVDEVYNVRNFIAHGDKIPDRYFTDTMRGGFNGRVSLFKVLLEAQSFIIRKSLLKIVNDGLLRHFADAGPAEAFFGGQHLTHTQIVARWRVPAAQARP
jgi:hypothetical protein